jgi:hypothetical protein
MRQIHPFPLFLGNAGAGRDYRAILDCGIQAIVQAAAEEPALQPPRDLIYCRFPLVDGPGNDLKLLQLAVATLARLIDDRIPTLVCCSMGLSRTPALAACALARALQQSPQEWLTRLAAEGPTDVAPGFWNELERLG